MSGAKQTSSGLIIFKKESKKMHLTSELKIITVEVRLREAAD